MSTKIGVLAYWQYDGTPDDVETGTFESPAAVVYPDAETGA
jgi:hypothetical protein